MEDKDYTFWQPETPELIIGGPSVACKEASPGRGLPTCVGASRVAREGTVCDAAQRFGIVLPGIVAVQHDGLVVNANDSARAIRRRRIEAMGMHIRLGVVTSAVAPL
jgi:hypothetical protein